MSRIFSNIKMRKSERGYTLAELLIYVALISILLLIIIQTSFILASTYKRSRAYLDINSAAINSFSRFSRDIRRATSVDLVNSVLGASPGRLVLLMKRDNGTDDKVSFDLSDSKIKVSENDVYLGDITQSNMAVSNLTFRRFTYASTTAIRIEMTLAPKASSSVPALNFYSTYVLRGSYLE